MKISLHAKLDVIFGSSVMFTSLSMETKIKGNDDV